MSSSAPSIACATSYTAGLTGAPSRCVVSRKDTLNAPANLQMTELTFYDILRISRTATFAELKKAYYQRAKECHPDLHHGSSARTEDFKRLVHAFNVLSDPLQRRQYDEQLRFVTDLGASGFTGDAIGYMPPDGIPIMDSVADDILEELIVGNDVPPGATLQSLMRDLESTRKFIRFREGKTLLFQNQPREAFQRFSSASAESPSNILYRYYLAATCLRLDMRQLARKHLELCLQLGSSRNPPQYLQRIRDELRRSRHQYRGFLGWLVDALKPPPPPGRFKSTEQQMIEEVSRSIVHIVRQEAREKRAADRQRRQLGEGKDDQRS